MHINNINSTNTPAFDGKLYTKGKWTPNLKEAFIKSPYTSNLLYTDYNVVARIKKHVVTFEDGIESAQHSCGDIIYKIYVSFVKNNPFAKLADMLGLIERISLTENYHREDGLIRSLDALHYQKFNKYLYKNA